ncbi:hypothetical protein [Aeromicrobium sp. IC_218]|uniref:hypothetical protein n=1 Tax=Aeromicrobium sp. IC_218 TaxID=2545468 RepID=UPI00103A56D6|nr:hypothetical protein [Aeromicrobium sp. IC_218]TCI96326.1 hypothetical protein E0W78_15155 [Aeromicrobium sp. IC_218]
MTDDPPRTAPRVTATFFASGRSVLTVDGVSQRHPCPRDVLERVVALARRQASRVVVVRVLTVDGTRIRLVAAADGTFRDETCPAQAYDAGELSALVLALAALDDEPDASPVRRRDPRGSVLVPDPLLSLPPW